MKIGIVTFHASDNCGSLLQAYALQRILEDLGHTVEIVDFSSVGQQILYSIVIPYNGIRSIAHNLLGCILYGVLQKEKRSYETFRKGLKLTGKHYTYNKDLIELDGKYDAFICGSDQIWNHKIADYDDAYFLNFVQKSRKIAYAASLGGKSLAETKETCMKFTCLLDNFYAVSVREERSINIVKSLYGKDVDFCLDPTLLFDSEEYVKFDEGRLIKEKYIFCYAFTYDKMFIAWVHSIAKRMSLPVYIICPKQFYRDFLGFKGIRLAPQTGPKTFISMMKYAEMVLTTSFHGTAFSVLYKKRFWYFNHHGSEGDGRATSLLRQVGLMSRYVTAKETEAVNLLTEIDYNNVYENLSENRTRSVAFLKKALSKT